MSSVLHEFCVPMSCAVVWTTSHQRHRMDAMLLTTLFLRINHNQKKVASRSLEIFFLGHAYVDVCNILQHNATHCNTLQRATTCFWVTLTSTSATYCNTLQHAATFFCVMLTSTSDVTVHLLHVTLPPPIEMTWRMTMYAVNSDVTDGVSIYCNVLDPLQHAATHCNTLQHAATHASTCWVGGSCEDSPCLLLTHTYRERERERERVRVRVNERKLSRAI